MTTDDLITYRIGRFSIQVPQSMKIVRRSAQLRHRELEEIAWSNDPKAASASAWNARLAEIEKKKPPEGKQKALIEVRDLGNDIRAMLYYGDSYDKERIFCYVLVSAPKYGLWISSEAVSDKVDRMLKQNLEIASAYRSLEPVTVPSKENRFYLEHGAIALPYISQEEAYARFEGHPLGLKLRVETKVVHEDEPQDEGLLGRLAAVLSTGFASGVDIKKIRTGKREIVGLKGEETILRAKSEQETDLSFLWRYAGKKDLGDHPEIVIEFETVDGQLDEKLKLWDAVLNSFKPVAQ